MTNALGAKCKFKMRRNIFVEINIFVWLICFHSGKYRLVRSKYNKVGLG